MTSLDNPKPVTAWYLGLPDERVLMLLKERGWQVDKCWQVDGETESLQSLFRGALEDKTKTPDVVLLEGQLIGGLRLHKLAAMLNELGITGVIPFSRESADNDWMNPRLVELRVPVLEGLGNNPHESIRRDDQFFSGIKWLSALETSIIGSRGSRKEAQL